MFLTLYYMAATWIQSWRLRTVSTKIIKQIGQGSVAFYNVQEESNDMEAVPTSSELCTNHQQAMIVEVLWYKDKQRGCSIIPMQRIHLNPWITFPNSPNLVPINVDERSEINLNPDSIVHLLIETSIYPGELDEEFLAIENYGNLVAWKVDSHFAILLETDVAHFTELITASFIQNVIFINDRLPLIRIESVSIEGNSTPQPFELLKSHSKKEFYGRVLHNPTAEQWEKHVTGLRNLGVLANQATEFVYNKNRTEGKTGIVKPDLISSKNIEDTLLIKKVTSSVVVNGGPSSSGKSSPIKVAKENVVVEPSVKVDAPKQIEKSTPIEGAVNLKQPTESISAQSVTLRNGRLECTSPKKESPLATPMKGSSPMLTPTQSSPIATPKKVSPIATPKKESPMLSPTQENSESLESHLLHMSQSTATIAIEDLQFDPPTPAKLVLEPSVSTTRNDAPRPYLKRSKESYVSTKPPNVLVYSDSSATRESVISTLHKILHKDMYTIYPLLPSQIENDIWIDNAYLLVVCGSVADNMGKLLLEFFLKGGKMLCLCSDLLHIVLPTYRTAEVREHELVQFSYGRWKKVRMMHHIFCYQPSPVRKHFSHDSDEPQLTSSRNPILMCPRSVEVEDLERQTHSLRVQILGTEETWNTPSLMLADNSNSGGRTVFSQVHLEVDPIHYEHDDSKFNVLMQSNQARLEILTDLLSSHLGIVVSGNMNDAPKPIQYKNAYFLGRHELKFELLEKLKPTMDANKTIQNGVLALRFCDRGTQAVAATPNFLPIMVHSCPDDFSTVDYFEHLKTENIGRLVIYAPIMTSSMNVINNRTLSHGLAVIPRQQTNGTGRGGNQWISADGCLMFSIQLHLPLSSTLGRCIPIIQHLIGVAVVHSIRSMPEYQDIDLALKWPNDIYANGSTKIGGLIINSLVDQEQAICNVGCGLNLSNSNPTICLNDLIAKQKGPDGKPLPLLTYEKALAHIFNEIETLWNRVQQNDDIGYLKELYYQYWLHSNTTVGIVSETGVQRTATILGIDDFGYLMVQVPDHKPEIVHPDGNSFDMLRGLIQPKY